MSITLVTAGDSDEVYYLYQDQLYADSADRFTPVTLPINAIITTLTFDDLNVFQSNPIIYYMAYGWTIYELVNNTLVSRFSHGDIFNGYDYGEWYPLTIPDTSLRRKFPRQHSDEIYNERLEQLFPNHDVYNNNYVRFDLMIDFREHKVKYIYNERYFDSETLNLIPAVQDTVGIRTIYLPDRVLESSTLTVVISDYNFAVLAQTNQEVSIFISSGNWRGVIDYKVNLTPPDVTDLKPCLDYQHLLKEFLDLELPQIEVGQVFDTAFFSGKKGIDVEDEVEYLRKRLIELDEETKTLKELLTVAMKKDQDQKIVLPAKIRSNGLDLSFISYEKALELLQKKEIIKYSIDPMLQFYARNLNKIITLLAKSGISYLVIAQYNNETLSPPLS